MNSPVYALASMYWLPRLDSFFIIVLRLALLFVVRALLNNSVHAPAREWAFCSALALAFSLLCIPASNSCREKRKSLSAAFFIASAFCLTAAVSFDEFAVAWFVSGLNKTVPVMILEILQGNTDPQINAIGSIVFAISMSLVVIAQLIFFRKASAPTTTGI